MSPTKERRKRGTATAGATMEASGVCDGKWFAVAAVDVT